MIFGILRFTSLLMGFALAALAAPLPASLRTLSPQTDFVRSTNQFGEIVLASVPVLPA